MSDNLDSILEVVTKRTAVSPKASSAQTGQGSESPRASSEASAVMTRYKDAYIVARTTNGFGGIIKAIGVIIAILAVIAGLAVTGNSRPNDPMAIFAVVGIAFGLFTGVLFYIIGVLVSAQGQILKASLDSAVNSSPFLTNPDRAKIMSL